MVARAFFFRCPATSLLLLLAFVSGFGTAQAETDAQRAAHYRLWAQHHGLRGGQVSETTPAPETGDRMRSRGRLAEADARMAAVYAAWPMIGPPTTATMPPYADHLFGDWHGIQPALARHGVTLSANYLGMGVANVSGGMRRGMDYAGQVSVGLDVDWGRLAGARGFSTHLLLMNRSGRPVGRDYVGDDIFNENEIYGAGGNVIAHLGYAYAEQILLHDRLDVTVGRMGAAMFFNASPFYCDFFSFGLCPTPRAVTGGSGDAFIMPPQNNWAVFARLSLGHDLYVRTGLSAAGGALGGRSGFDWSTHGVTGVMLPFEGGWTPDWGADHRPVHLRAGFYATTGQADDVALNRAGGLLALVGGTPLQHRGYFAAWAGGDAMLVRQGTGDEAGLVMIFNYAHSDDRVSVYRDMGVIGLTDRGFWPVRSSDRVGILFLYSEQSVWLRRHVDRAGLGPAASHTGVLEAQYGAHVAPGTVLTPDIQYVIRPGAAGAYPDAVVLGVSLQVGF